MNWYGMSYEERYEAVESLLAQQSSRSEIAERLGAESRNVICGWINRNMPDVYHPTKEARAQQNRHSARQAGKARRARKPRPAILQRPLPKQPPARPVALPLPTEGLVRFIDYRLHSQCAYPCWPDNQAWKPSHVQTVMVCGRPVEGEGKSYCEAHRRLCFDARRTAASSRPFRHKALELA